jgi:hypothetical protein
MSYTIVLWLMAGAAAERRSTGQALLDGDDREKARLIIAAYLKTNENDPRVTARLQRYDVLADAVVSEHWRWIQAVADRLDRKKEIDGGIVADLIC